MFIALAQTLVYVIDTELEGRIMTYGREYDRCMNPLSFGGAVSAFVAPTLQKARQE